MCALCDDHVPAPLDGNSDRVEDYARAFDKTASALRSAITELHRIANEELTISDAITEVREKAAEGEVDAGKVATRYEGAASAYHRYASDLAEAQADANSARGRIDTNNTNGRWWRHRFRELDEGRWMHNADPDYLKDLADAAQHASHYDGVFAELLGAYQAAVEKRDSAVRTAIAGLQAAAEASHLNDGWFDALLGDLQNAWDLISTYLGPVIEALRDVLKVLKQIVDVLALIVTILSIVFPVLGPIALALTVISALLAIGVFLCSLTLFAMGRETLGTVIADGIMAVVSVVAAKFAGASSFTETLAKGFNVARSASVGLTFTTRTTVLASSELTAQVTRLIGEPVVSAGTALGAAAMINLKTGLVNANVSPFAFVIGEGFDFSFGSNHGAWGADPVWNMEGADPVHDLVPNILDQPLLGVASPVAGAVDALLNGFGQIGADFAEVGSVWGQISVVPAGG